jgi:amidophosphoribosyltransferase
LKPLCYAFDGKLFAAASESVALFNLGFSPEQIKDVPPGYVAIVTKDSFELKEFAPSPRTAHCFFEWVYCANAASVIDGKSVYLARKRLGEELARRETVELDENSIVVPVPETSKAAADGMAYALGIPCLEGLMRNRYTGRTFIEGGETRRRKAETKYTPLPQILEGKRVFLVDDSIVRSTTMRVLIERIYEVGRAKEIHVRVACPPVVAPCFYGIDMSTYSELFAVKFLAERYGFAPNGHGDDPTSFWKVTPEIEAEMAADIGCDSLHFLPPSAISRAVGIPSLNLCEACANHEYPTEWGCKLMEQARQRYLEQMGK